MRMSLKTRSENGKQRPVKERFQRSNIGHYHYRNVVVEQADTEFPSGGLVIWAREQRFVHLDAGVGDETATGQDRQATGEGKRESRGEILHGREKEMRIFTGPSDSIRHRTASENRALA